MNRPSKNETKGNEIDTISPTPNLITVLLTLLKKNFKICIITFQNLKNTLIELFKKQNTIKLR